MEAPTKRQKEVLDCIRRLTAAQGYAPSRSEIARELGVGTQQAVDAHVKALIAKGWLQRTKGSARTLRLCTPTQVAVVALDEKAPSMPTISGRWADAFQPRADYFAEVADDSMSGLNVERGDLLAVQSTTEAQSGDVIIVRLAKTRACRRLEHLDGGMVRLTPAPRTPDSAVRPIMLDEAALVIEGIVIGTIACRSL